MSDAHPKSRSPSPSAKADTKSRSRSASPKPRRSKSRSRSPPRRRSRSRSRSRSPRSGGAGGADVQTGVSLRWNDRGFGFIKPDAGGEDVFCHVTSITDGNYLKEGSAVKYTLSYDDRKGKYRAENVTGGSQDDSRGPGAGGTSCGQSTRFT